ncbi:MAG: DUF4384 domain-containing protein [Deltaproteobacteria bacterium]|nr:DUF4384 domain-containing protein [Deltaproteobacteria bacterium]
MAQVIIEDFLRLAGKEIPVWDCAATGILTNFISIAEEVGKVDAIGAKIKAALASLGREGVVFYPRTNDPLNPALRQEAEQKQITLVVVDTPRQAIDLLLEKYGILEGADGGGGEAEPERDWLKWILRGLLLCSIVALGWFITSWLRAPSLAVPQKPATTTSIETAPLRTEPVPQPAVDAALYYEGKTGEPVPLPQEKGLTEGDGFRVRLEVDRDCFVYIFGLDGNQSLKWLFPAHSSSRLLFGEKHWIPEDGRWFYLDDITGEETILIWATPSPSSWLEDMWNKLPEHNEVRAFPSPKLESDLFAYLQDEEKKGRGTQKRLTFQHE